MPHRRRTWTVQPYSPGCASVLCIPPNICFHLGPSESTTQTASPSVQPFLHGSRQCRRACLGISFLPKKLHLCMEQSGRTSNTWFLWPTRIFSPNCISSGSAVFAQLTAECPYTLQWAAPFPQNCPFPCTSVQYLIPYAHPSPQPKTVSRLVQPLLQGSRCGRQTNRETDRLTTLLGL